jgi:hypothetical protein
MLSHAVQKFVVNVTTYTTQNQLTVCPAGVRSLQRLRGVLDKMRYQRLAKVGAIPWQQE